METQHVFGNFRSYYKFHPSSARLELFRAGFFLSLWEKCGRCDTFKILDVGCNEGDLTLAIFERARLEIPSEVRVFCAGVDIDPVLVERSRVKSESAGHNDVQFMTCNVMVPEQLSATLVSYGTFDLVTLFSVTMWVHLNYGNSGLCGFLTSMSNKTSGALLVEPQDSKSYRTAAKRCRKLGIGAPHHKLDHGIVDAIGDHISAILTAQFGERVAKKLGNEDVWGRSLLLFQRFDDEVL